MFLNNRRINSQLGFSLIEIMVGLVIGLLASLVIMQVFATFEGQKRTTTGSADAQTNGSIALFTMQRDIQMAGFGLSLFDTQNSPLQCNPSVTVNHDGNAATPNIDMFPIQITDGGAAGSDTVVVRYATDGANAKGGVAIKIIGPAPAVPTIGVDNNFSCNNGDVVLLSNGSTCSMTKVNDPDLNIDTTHITLLDSTGAAIGGSVACIGNWNQFTYAIANNQLQRNDARNLPAATTPIVSDIVSIKAQYGVSAVADNNQITEWVSATAPWDAPSIADRNRIKAVHIAVVARNGLYEKEVVTAAAPVIWADVGASAAPVIDLSGDANWQHYRYRVYETIIPLRNMIWSKNTL